MIGSAIATQPTNFAGEYTDRNFLNGQATFQMSLEQSASTVTVWFSAGYNDGHGLLPEADGSGKITPKGTVEFTFKDSARRALSPEHATEESRQKIGARIGCLSAMRSMIVSP
ncbi:MAG: hypothetical protein DME35_07655 [Verrucomicrobia bacterium]|nr:MAG: hypothetical protein DME35_07655 [Verrucomicrobiota bacterium]